MTPRRTLWLITAALLASGCSSEPRTVDAGTSTPAGAPAAGTGRRVITPAGGREPAEPAGPRSPVALAFTDAVRDLTGKIAAQAARGWPAHIPLSSLPPPRPVVRVDDLINRSSEHVDTAALADELVQRLIEQNQVEVVVRRGEDYEAALDERAYAEAMGEEATFGAEPQVGLLVRGEISDDVVAVDGERRSTITIVLRLIDVQRGSLLLQARTVSQTVR